jgi:hypothetical protein
MSIQQLSLSRTRGIVGGDRNDHAVGIEDESRSPHTRTILRRRRDHPPCVTRLDGPLPELLPDARREFRSAELASVSLLISWVGDGLELWVRSGWVGGLG